MTARNPGLELPDCNPNIFKKGTAVFITDLPAEDAESWVKEVAQASGQPVDWSYMGGRVVVKALGDLDRVKAAITALLSQHDWLQQAYANDPTYCYRRFLDEEGEDG